MTPLSVSVIIPLYNSARYIGATLDSVLAQTRPAAEIIVVNDGSTDEGGAVVARYGAPVRVVEQSNAGVSAARNTGLESSSGALLAFVDADDVWAPEKLAQQVARLSTGDAVLVHAGIGYIDSAGQDITPGRDDFPRPLAGDCLTDLLFEGDGICTSSVLVRRTALARAGRFEPGRTYAEDYALWLELAYLGTFAYCPEPLVKYRLHSTAATAHNTLKQVLQHLEVVVAFCARHPDLSTRCAPKSPASRLFHLEFDLAERARRAHAPQALQYYWRAFRRDPLAFYGHYAGMDRSERLRWYLRRMRRLLGHSR